MAPTLALVVTTPPNNNKTATALNIATQAVEAGYKLVGVFFYQQGVLNASSLVQLPNDEFQITKKWQLLHQEYNIPLHLCITAAEKNGLSDGQTLNTKNILDCYTISGLGELVELSATTDKVVQL